MMTDEFESEYEAAFGGDPYDIPGPIPDEASHGIEYDYENYRVVTYAIFGPERRFRMNTRNRPMCDIEVFMADIRHLPLADRQRLCQERENG